uniref:Guanine nucleotide-binding protein subunit gamma n=1 Tax=Tetranychus urticae TaxID=32264 RepID=T1JYW6_TETUR
MSQTSSHFSALERQRLREIEEEKQNIKQLRREVAIRRIKVSKAVEDLKKYTEAHEQKDYLWKGFKSIRENPFRERPRYDICGCLLSMLPFFGYNDL